MSIALACVSSISRPEMCTLDPARTLFKLCRNGKEADLRTHLQKYALAVPPPRTTSDETPLHIVASTHPDPTPLLTLLLEAGHAPNIRAHFTHNRTALHEAARRTGSEAGSAIHSLLLHGAKVDAVKKGDWTALMVAGAAGNAQSIRVLIEAGAQLRLKNIAGACAIHLAARKGCMEGVGIMLERDAGLVHLAARNGRRVLHFAARGGRREVVELLLEYRAEVGAVDKGGMCAGHEAAIGGSVECVRVLMNVEGGREAMWRGDCGGLGGLHYAAMEGRVDVVRALVEDGGDVKRKDGRGLSALFLAIWHGREGAAKEIMKGGGEIEDEWAERFERGGKTTSLGLLKALKEVG